MLNPRVDFAFKKLFGTEENKDILISFINAVVSEDDQVIDVHLLNPYNNKQYQTDKLSILDIKAIDEQGRQYNIEMQITDQAYYNQRALYYWSRLYVGQLHEGDTFGELKKTIGINVLNFDCFDDEPAYHNVFSIMHTQSYRRYFNDFEFHFIELHKFNDETHPIKTTLDRWVKFLKKAHRYDKMTFPDELKAVPAIEKAFTSLSTLSLNKDERDIYDARLKWLRDEDASLQKAHEKGVEQGIEQIAIKMLAANKPLDEISELTGLSQQDISLLQQKQIYGNL